MGGCLVKDKDINKNDLIPFLITPYERESLVLEASVKHDSSVGV